MISTSRTISNATEKGADTNIWVVMPLTILILLSTSDYATHCTQPCDYLA